MSLMKVILRATGLTATILSLTLSAQQTKQKSNITAPFPLVVAASEEPPPPIAPPAPAKVQKPNWFMRMFENKVSRAVVGGAAPTPVGVQVLMSDGTVQTFPLGVWIEFASGASCSPACSGGQLRGIFPTQYVNQIAVVNNGPFGTGAVFQGVVFNPPGTTTLTSLSFTSVSGGSGYVLPMVSITGGTGTPGNVTATVVGGVITAINAPNATGYTIGDVLTVTITDIPQTWKYPKPGRNVQVWRNGLLQRLGPDYTLNTTTGYIIPVLYQDASGALVAWNLDDYITVAYLY
jgi:hypothetical protein